MTQNTARATYTDNNGFLRYEATGKLVVNQPDNQEVLSEMYRIFHRTPAPPYSLEYSNYLEGRCLRNTEEE